MSSWSGPRTQVCPGTQLDWYGLHAQSASRPQRSPLTEQAPYFATLSLHAREQLLYGLTDGYAMLGQTDKARATYERMQHDAAGSELLPRAAERAAGHTVAGDAPCEQCHAR